MGEMFNLTDKEKLDRVDVITEELFNDKLELHDFVYHAMCDDLRVRELEEEKGHLKTFFDSVLDLMEEGAIATLSDSARLKYIGETITKYIEESESVD